MTNQCTGNSKAGTRIHHPQKRSLVQHVAGLLTSFLLSTSIYAQSNDNVFLDAGIQPQVLEKALRAYAWAHAHHKIHKPILTIVDFTQESVDKRLWVLNLKTKKVLFTGLVTHGSNSGLLKATHFSNQPKSRTSSIGAFATEWSYHGQHGYSLRLVGLEKGLNDQALSRAIVVHPAPYATPEFAQAAGYLGRSWGCFALDPRYAANVINTIRGGSLVFAYAPPLEHDPHY